MEAEQEVLPSLRCSLGLILWVHRPMEVLVGNRGICPCLERSTNVTGVLLDDPAPVNVGSLRLSNRTTLRRLLFSKLCPVYVDLRVRFLSGRMNFVENSPVFHEHILAPVYSILNLCAALSHGSELERGDA